jgi:hypothetical protein
VGIYRQDDAAEVAQETNANEGDSVHTGRDRFLSYAKSTIKYFTVKQLFS